MTALSQSILADIDARFAGPMENLALTMRDEMRELIGIQVEYAGGDIIRSLPGEAPRREFGNLQDSQQIDVTVNQNEISATLFTDSLIGAYLEHGTSRILPRPHYEPYAKRVESLAAEMFGFSAAGV